MTAEGVRNHLRAGRWRAMHRGVYVLIDGGLTLYPSFEATWSSRVNGT